MKIKIHYTFYMFFVFSFFCNFFVETLLMFVILLCHEIGHLYFLKKYKRDISSITFYPFGGIIRHSNNSNSNLSEDFFINFGGIFINLILFCVFYFLNLNTCMLLNFGILFFNILPIYPLDGGKIVKNILNYFFCFKTSFCLNIIISFISLISLLIINFIYIESVYLYFLVIALGNLNVRALFDLNKEYQYFLTSKYIYPNSKLKDKKIYKFKNPLNKLYLGRNAVFVIDDVCVLEYDVLKRYFKN